jgi:hypothetical protein
VINDRGITNSLNWVLDNLVPPFLRDSKIFMGVWFSLLFGDKSKYFMEFKERAPHLSQEEYEKYYQLLSDVHLQRDTDLTGKCVQRILSRIQGESVLDVGCGKGYLVGKIASEKGIQVVGVDIAAPEQQEASLHVTFVRHKFIPCLSKTGRLILCCVPIQSSTCPTPSRQSAKLDALQQGGSSSWYQGSGSTGIPLISISISFLTSSAYRRL